MLKIKCLTTGEIIETEATTRQEAQAWVAIFVKLTNESRGGSLKHKRDNKNNYVIIEE